MEFVEAVVRRDLPFPAATVYAIVADVRDHHFRVVPESVDRSTYRVLEGGYGAGTVVEYQTAISRIDHPLRYLVEEPEPGRVVVFRHEGGLVEKRYEVDAAGPAACTMTSRVRVARRAGFLGIIDRLLGRSFIQRMAEQKLDNIEQYAATLGAVVVRSRAGR